MGLLRQLFGGAESRAAHTNPPQSRVVEATVLTGDSIVAVVGEASYQPAIRAICGSSKWEDVRYDCMAALVPEPSNRYDPHAVMVQVDGQLVGYLSRGDALDYQPAIKAFAERGKLIACDARIAGRGPGSETHNLGVFLHMPDADEALQDAAA